MIIKCKTKAGTVYSIDEDKEIHRGGEGRIILINNSLVAKIYHPNITPITEDKFIYLHKLDKSSFVAPEELLYDGKGKVIGFTMQYLGQNFFPISTITGKTFCLSNNIDSKIKVKIAKALIKAVEAAHSQGVVIGDLNPLNILITVKGDIKMIDTDSYEVPGVQHTGILLDDIRDYLYHGKVSKTSDFFALSIVIFNFLTYVHPFKGIHKTIKTLAERMIKKLPVFCGDPNIIIPKCYEPIQDSFLTGQFERLYLNGERFLFSLDKSMTTVATLPRITIKPVVQNDLIISNILIDAPIRSINFLSEQGIITTDDSYYIFDTKNHGYVTKKQQFIKSEADEIYITNKNIVARRKNQLFYFDSGTFKEITNFKMPENAIISQHGNILIIVGESSMYWLYMDSILAGNIKTKSTSAFGKGFRNYNGLVQHAGGVQYFFYNGGNEISTVRTDLNIVGLFQYKNFGVVEYKEKNTTKIKFFKLDNLTIVLASEEMERVNNFAYKASNDKNGFIFQAADNSIKIIRTEDFQEVSAIDCDLISSTTVLQNCNAGIVAWEGENCWLLNKK